MRNLREKPGQRGFAFCCSASAILLLGIGLLAEVSGTSAAASGPVLGPAAAAAATRSDPLSAAQAYFDAVAPEDRENFIKFHLDKALEQRIPYYKSSTPQEFTTYQDSQEPEHFSVNLLDHFMTSFGLDQLEVYEFVALGIICFPSGWCFNPDDVGNICCPF
ncbi:uncharacterized protein LOC125955573 [Anopheles darlingi]|uniref:uncharacterized protein LOC125955573 n=1 Tax=Anopheles darlingi TaxID=43151 RepID=UPI00210056C5|nr:uncharacterized protein LOC125955573 [Anopheles darlingi]